MASSRTLQLAAACACLCSLAHAQGLPPGMLEPLRWRMIGPFRGGRTVAATGVPGRPNEFLIGVNNGGVWKTTDYGRVWTPIFDDQPTGSIGAIAVAPSRPDMIYVGSGEGLQRPDLSTGDGIYKSSDGGRTWQHLGLRDAQQIAAIIVDPHEPDRLFVAALGHPYGPNDERGIFRSLDGGHSFTRVLYRDADTGAFDVAFDPGDARIVYAVLWAGRQAPWEIGSSFDGPGSGLFKSEDGGATWRQLERGLPTWADRLGRIGLGLAPSDARRIYATVDSPTQGGLYRSDDAGESWQRINADGRLWGRGSDFAEVKVDPRNPEIVYVANVVTWKSTDGGKTFTAFRGAPGGDDYHRLWISGENSNVILLASDQGAIITVNGGATFSSWYNQPTAQFYHVITDNRFPYRVYGGQQESGSVGIVSRGDDGQITFREWHPVGVEEYGYVAPDPLDPDIVYGGKLTRFDWRTGEVQNVAPVMLRARLPDGAHLAGDLLAGRSARAVLRVQRRLAHAQRGAELGADQPRPEPRGAGGAEEPGRVHRSRSGARQAPRRDLHAGAVAARSGAAVGRHRRRADPRDPRRRQDLAGRHAARARAVVQGVVDGGIALRARHRVRGDQHLPPRRAASARAAHARRRPDLGRDRERHARWCDRERGARGPGAPRPAVRWIGDRGVGLVRCG
ncbi:MAG: hypothetical protein U1E76_06925 [Planctomycetota bacterium]